GEIGVPNDIISSRREELWSKFACGFNELPVHILKHHGQYSMDNYLSHMEAYLRGPSPPDVIVLDNINFMLGSGQSIWERQDDAIRRLRVFATLNNVHLIVVMHPRKLFN